MPISRRVVSSFVSAIVLKQSVACGVLFLRQDVDSRLRADHVMWFTASSRSHLQIYLMRAWDLAKCLHSLYLECIRNSLRA